MTGTWVTGTWVRPVSEVAGKRSDMVATPVLGSGADRLLDIAIVVVRLLTGPLPTGTSGTVVKRGQSEGSAALSAVPQG